MRLAAPISTLSQHRLQRLMLRARLWLPWFLGWLLRCFGEAGHVGAHARHGLRALRGEAMRLVFLAAVASMRQRRSYTPAHAPIQRCIRLRAFFGAKLRHMLFGKGSLRERFEALRQALNAPGAIIAALTKRLNAFGFRVGRGASADPSVAPMLQLTQQSAACADTS